MLLTITTTRQPANDLGYLLHKHRERFQSFDMSFGRVQADLALHQQEYERLRAELEQSYQESKLPEAPSGAVALHDLLVHLRLGASSSSTSSSNRGRDA